MSDVVVAIQKCWSVDVVVWIQECRSADLVRHGREAVWDPESL